MEKLLNILKEIRGTIDFEKEKNLIDDGLLDSVDVVTLVGELSSQMFEKHEFDYEDLCFGSQRILIGFFKKQL